MDNASFSQKWSPRIKMTAGFTQVPNILLDNQTKLNITTSELVTLTHIIRYVKPDKSSAVSIEKIARLTGRSHKTHRRNIRELERKGLIKRFYRKGEPSIYHLKCLVDKLDNLASGSTQNRAPPMLKYGPKDYPNTGTNNKGNNFKRKGSTESLGEIMGDKYGGNN